MLLVCRMVWYGVWYSMLYGIILYRMVSYGIAGSARHDMAWHGGWWMVYVVWCMVWYGAQTEQASEL